MLLKRQISRNFRPFNVELCKEGTVTIKIVYIYLCNTAWSVYVAKPIFCRFLARRDAVARRQCDQIWRNFAAGEKIIPNEKTFG
jgi:hypothetical protein